ncbi:MAG TPA: hypothetical protein VK474_12315 [Chthoniobacterales bacterium]|nr:hypothetical protein [Chthoniobacterales bacterium]
MRIFVGGVFLAVASLIWVGPVVASAEPLRFHGQIVDGQSGKPVANARVRVFDELDLVMAAASAVMAGQRAISTPRKPRGFAYPKATVTSDSRGRFSVTVRLKGRCEIIVDRPGSKAGKRIANAPANKFLEIRL